MRLATNNAHQNYVSVLFSSAVRLTFVSRFKTLSHNTHHNALNAWRFPVYLFAAGADKSGFFTPNSEFL